MCTKSEGSTQAILVRPCYRPSHTMCDCEISVGLTEVPLLHGETVLMDVEGEGGCYCGISCECCPKEYGRLTNRRMIVLQKRGGVLHSAALCDEA